MKKDKATEKAALKALFGMNGYFADTFSLNDMNTMLNNIDSDYPLLMGTEFNKKNEEVEIELNSMKMSYSCEANKNYKLANEFADLADVSAKAHGKLEMVMQSLMETYDAQHVLYTHFEMADIVKYKLANDIELNSIDKNYITSKI